MHGNHPQSHNTQQTPEPSLPTPLLITDHPITDHRKGWTTWWLSRGARTRSHPELGRENPQRPWYCASRHGRVGRRQVFQPFHNPSQILTCPIRRQTQTRKYPPTPKCPKTIRYRPPTRKIRTSIQII